MMDNFWEGRPVFVTGATGMVGSWLIKDLVARRAQVVALVRDPDPQSEFYRSGLYRQTTIIQGRLEEFWTLERAINEHQIDTVFHLGAQAIVGAAHRFPLQTFEANIRGTYHLLEACRLHRSQVKRVVVASSDKAYGPQPHLPYTEAMALQGIHPYEVSKSCADLIVQAYYHTYRLPVAIARCGNIYGGGDLNWSRIVPHTIRACLQGAAPIVRSDGAYIRDYIYVKDVSQAYLQLAEYLDRPAISGEAFNFSMETPLSVLQLVAQIQGLMQCQHLTPEVQNIAQGEIQAQYLDATKARELLAWQPQFGLEEGLLETIAWYRNYHQPGQPKELTA